MDEKQGLVLAIILSTITMFVVLITLDLNQIFVTPLSPYGANHWIPELLGIFLFGRLLTRVNRKLIPVILGCIFFYPIFTHALVDQLSFGLGTSSVFVAAILLGIWSGAKKKERK